MTSFGLNPQSLNQAVDDITGMTNQLKSKIDELDSTIQRFNLTNSGETPAAFLAAQTRWDAGMATMQNSLGKGGINLQEINNGYIRTDKHGAGTF